MLLCSLHPILSRIFSKFKQDLEKLRYKIYFKNKTFRSFHRIDMLSEGARDLYKLILWGYMQGFLMDKPKEWENALTKVKERYFPVFEKVCRFHLMLSTRKASADDRSQI